MYSEWASLQSVLEEETSNHSVLNSFPAIVGREVACNVVKTLASGLSTASAEPSPLSTEKQVKWNMEVLCFGLSLPLSEHDTIRDCVNVYCEWLTALTYPKVCVPRPIQEEPHQYCQEVLQHLFNVFVPRPAIGFDLVKRQAVLCHRVLRTLENITQDSFLMDRDTWESVLRFLLSVNDALLSPPTSKDGIGDQLCERVVSVLFEIWIRACAKSFPSPPLWKTFQELCATWRHHEALVGQWHRVNVAFTSRVLRFLYGPEYPTLPVPDEDQRLIPETMDSDCLAQCWFRFLHILGNPVDLSRPHNVSNTPKFMQMALTADPVIDPHQHECLRVLPIIFQKAMKGISSLVDAFLGTNYALRPSSHSQLGHSATLPASHQALHSAGTPPHQRKNKTPSLIPPSSSKGSTKSSTSKTLAQTPSGSPTQHIKPTKLSLAAGRPTVNSVLHMFGAWLFEASLTGVHVYGAHANTVEDPSIMGPNLYQAGRAEACGTLCRIFSSHKTGEVIKPVYLTRFYTAIYYGLQTNTNGEVLASIIINAADLMRVDLDGVLVLVPSLLGALEAILTDLSPKFRCDFISPVDLRRSSIHLLMSILALPLHFKDTPVKGILETKEPSSGTAVMFSSLKGQMVELLLKALLIENDSQNTQMLLGALAVGVQDLAQYEAAENLVQQDETEESGASQPSSSKTAESAHSLFGHAASLICHRLMASWKVDLNVALAAMEVLSSLTKLKMSPQNSLMCKRTVNWICEFIQYQCSRPAPLHSKDLHSMIVAAFHCLTLWVVEHSYLMQDKECLHCVLEVVELGISGAKSQPGSESEAPSPIKTKGSKQKVAFAFPPNEQNNNSSSQGSSNATKNWQKVRKLSLHGMRSKSEGSAGPRKEQLVHHRSFEDILKPSDSDGRVTFYIPLTEDQDQHLNRASDQPKLKGDKELKPVSLRVKEVAECLLACIMDQVGTFPPPCGPESSCSLLDEDSLLKIAKDGSSTEQMASPFRYFVIDGMVIVGLLEQPLGNDENPQPTVTAVVRGPFGRHIWSMQLRHLPRHKKVSSKALLAEPKRPEPDDSVGVHYNIKHRNFPTIVQSVPHVNADKSLPELDTSEGDEAFELMRLNDLIRNQLTFENVRINMATSVRQALPIPDPKTECRPPNICHDFQTARLLLSHYGFLSLESLKDPANSSAPPSLVMLDSSEGGYLNDLEQLDSIPTRSPDTAFIFYVKAGQKMPFEILYNVARPENVHPQFLEFLLSLGWPVDVKKHAGWTGHVSTSWSVQANAVSEKPVVETTGGSAFDGRKMALYWADIMSEIAFVVPSHETYQPVLRRTSFDNSSESSQGSTSSADVNRPQRLVGSGPIHPPKSLSLDLEDKMPPQGSRLSDSSITPTENSSSRQHRTNRYSQSNLGTETKVYIVWLESFEDHENFPEGDFLQTTLTGLEPVTSGSNLYKMHERNIHIIFIHPLQNGLFRIKIRGQQHGKMTMGIPLVDGMVLSRRTLGTLIRQTVINICHRKRLENDIYQPPHVRRKLKIREMVDKYRNKLIEPEFYTALFQ